MARDGVHLHACRQAMVARGVAHMMSSRAVEEKPQLPQTTVEASSPPNSCCTTDWGRPGAVSPEAPSHPSLPVTVPCSVRMWRITGSGADPEQGTHMWCWAYRIAGLRREKTLRWMNV